MCTNASRSIRKRPNPDSSESNVIRLSLALGQLNWLTGVAVSVVWFVREMEDGLGSLSNFFLQTLVWQVDVAVMG